MSQKPSNSSAQDSYRHAIDEALAINPQEEDIMSYPNLQEFNPPVSELSEYSDVLKAVSGQRSIQDWEDTEEFPRE